MLNPKDIRLYVPHLLPTVRIWSLNVCSKENQIKQQKKEELEREKAVKRAYVAKTPHPRSLLTSGVQPTSLFLSLLAAQYSPRAAIPGPHRHELHKL